MRAMLTLLAILAGAPGSEPSVRFPKGLSRPAEAGTDHHEGAPRTEACAECHPEVAERFAMSGHADAAAHFVFRVSVAREVHAETCLRCHAPAEAEPDGVGCAACHVDGGRVVSARAMGGAGPVARDAAFEDGRLCAGCHQFGFVARDAAGAVVGLSAAPHLQQDTFGEWSRWVVGAPEPRSCVACHFEDHTFGGKRRYERLAGALDVTPNLNGRGLTIVSRGVGHALPTGDVMRWLAVEVSTSPAFEPEVTRRVAIFGRRLAERDWGDGLPPHTGIRSDQRLWPGDPVSVTLPPRRWRHWRVVYHLLSEAYEDAGVLPVGLSARTILEGRIP